MVSTSSVLEGCVLTLVYSSLPQMLEFSALVSVLYIKTLKVFLESENGICSCLGGGHMLLMIVALSC